MDGVSGLMRQAASQAVASAAKFLEQLGDLWMIDRLIIVVHQQVLLADIGHVGTFLIFRQQVIEGLVAPRPLFFRNLFEPFFRIGVDRIDIENDAAKIMATMLHHVPNSEASA